MIQHSEGHQKAKGNRPPRQPRKEPYSKINSYNQPPSKQFILTLFLFISQLVLHSVFLCRAMIKINQPLLYIMWSFNYLIILVIGYDYVILTCKDPVDRSLIYQNYRDRHSTRGGWFCNICSKNLPDETYHCNRCNRCVQQFDHHCTFLNNCIGGRNYENFLRILFIMILYNLNYIGEGVWVLVRGFEDSLIEQQFYHKAPVFVFIIISFSILVVICVLLALHIYLNCMSLTTLEYLQQQYKKQIEMNEIINSKKNTNNTDHANKIFQSSQFLKKDRSEGQP